MEKRRVLYLVVSVATLAMLLGLSACSPKKAAGSGSTVSLHFPTGAEAMGAQPEKESAQSTYDFSRVCYAVNVTGGGIPTTQPTSCDIPLGVFAGFALPGGDLSLQVPRGSGRRLEIYAYMRKTSSEPCPQDRSGFATMDRSRVARVGVVPAFDAQGDDVTLQVNVNAPGTNESLVSQYSLPNSCAPKTIPGVGASTITAGNATIRGGNFIMQGTISGEKHEAVLTGGNFIMQVSRRAQ